MGNTVLAIGGAVGEPARLHPPDRRARRAPLRGRSMTATRRRVDVRV